MSSLFSLINCCRNQSYKLQNFRKYEKDTSPSIVAAPDPKLFIMEGESYNFSLRGEKAARNGSGYELTMEIKKLQNDTATKMVFEYNPAEDSPSEVAKEIATEFELSDRDKDTCQEALRAFLRAEGFCG